MKRNRHIHGRTKLVFCLAGLAIGSVCVQTAARSGEKTPKLLPELKNGEILNYDIQGRVQRHVKSQSRVTTILPPREEKQEISGQLRITIKDVGTENGRMVVIARAEFVYPTIGPEANPASEKHYVDFTIGGNGQVKNVAGYDELDPIERIAWQFWISQFAFGWTLPSENMKPGEKWKNVEPENNPMPIAHLVWDRETTYGENDVCPAGSTEACAVFYTSAALKQKSSSKDSTPEDYRLHELKTSGTAGGANDIYTMISHKTGLTMRGSEDMRQSMNVVIAMADASNAVKYTMDAVSHFEMMLVIGGATAPH